MLWSCVGDPQLDTYQTSEGWVFKQWERYDGRQSGFYKCMNGVTYKVIDIPASYSRGSVTSYFPIFNNNGAGLKCILLEYRK